jgi:hypothetical protein
MKELTSKKTKHVQIVDDEVYRQLVSKGMIDRFNIVDIPARILKDKPIEIRQPITQPTKKQPPKTNIK